MEAFARILARTQTQELALWDSTAYENALGWGAYFEKITASLRPVLPEDGGQRAPYKNEKQDNEWLQNCSKNLQAWEAKFWGNVSMSDLRNARTSLVDRHILHSPYVDANPALIQLVLERSKKNGKMSAIAKLLEERYRVDNAVSVAHQSLHILRSALDELQTEGPSP